MHRGITFVSRFRGRPENFLAHPISLPVTTLECPLLHNVGIACLQANRVAARQSLSYPWVTFTSLGQPSEFMYPTRHLPTGKTTTLKHPCHRAGSPDPMMVYEEVPSGPVPRIYFPHRMEGR